MITFTSSVLSMLMSVAVSAAAQDPTLVTDRRPVPPDAQVVPPNDAALTAGAPGTRITTVCPADAIFSHPVTDSGTAGNSDVDGGYKIYDNYSTYNPIEDIHFWGISAYYSGGWFQCTPNAAGELFLIEFWNDDGTGAPDTTAPVCTYNLTIVPTPDGTWGSWNAYYYQTNLVPACVLPSGWVSVQGTSVGDSCWFLWVNSAYYDGAYQSGTPTTYDVGFCLTGQFVERFGACCDELTGNCVDDVSEQDCQGPFLRFAADTLCANLDPPCEPPPVAACCIDGICIANFTETECTASGGSWFEGESCFASPPFECPPPPGCPVPSCFVQNPSGPTEWQTAYPCDSYFGYMAYENYWSAGYICGVHFFGLELEWSGAWYGCDDSDITFDIVFYPDADGQPDVNNPSCVYLNVPPTTRTTYNDQLYNGNPLRRYALMLSPCCELDSTWISVNGADGDSCVFLWMDSREGDDMFWRDVGSGGFPESNNLSLCLICGCPGPLGACCDDATGICTDNVMIQDCYGPDLRFLLLQTCDDFDPPCGTGGCCLGQVCAPESPVPEEDCLAAGGYYLGDGVSCTDDLCDCGGTDYRGDANCLGDGPNSYDIDAFILAIGNPAEWIATYGCDYYCANDTNCDGAVNAYDIDSFVWCVSQGQCDPCP